MTDPGMACIVLKGETRWRGSMAPFNGLQSGNGRCGKQPHALVVWFHNQSTRYLSYSKWIDRVSCRMPEIRCRVGEAECHFQRGKQLIRVEIHKDEVVVDDGLHQDMSLACGSDEPH